MERTIKPTETYIGKPSIRCWATDMAEKNGHYYFYFSNGNKDTGVLCADHPAGPFEDVLGKPLLDAALTITKEYDPTVLVDDDAEQTAYIAFGHWRDAEDDHYYGIAKLNEDMMSLAEHPREIKITNAKGGGADKPTLHKNNGIYYLSAGSNYGMSTNVYGPYAWTGNSGNEKYGLTGRAHGNYFEWNNQWFHVWCDFVYGKEVARYRDSHMTYLHYRANGEMVDDVNFLDAHFDTGVGQYDASWNPIQAEWYMAATQNKKGEKADGGFEIQHIQLGSTLAYPNMKGLSGKKAIAFMLSSISAGGTIEVRANSTDGPVLGKCRIPNTGSWDTYQSVACPIVATADAKDLYLCFKGKANDLCHLDSFSFSDK